jgi:uncharacterized phage-associated protein
MTLLPIHSIPGGIMIEDTEVTIADVARYILDQFGQMTTMKLQKLCYYTQAWHLASFGVPLFNEDFEAWNNGPVCRDLYELHKGQYSITSVDIEGRSDLNQKYSNFVESIVGAYITFSGDELSSISHMESPWASAKDYGNRTGLSNVQITKESMHKFYSSLNSTNSKEIEK